MIYWAENRNKPFNLIYEDSLSLRLRWVPLTKPLPMSRRLILQQARGQGLVPLPLLESLRFHVLFHSPMGVLFTLPSRYNPLF
ncbi:hypothetical protein SOVF_142410 [Spinacia oleracea]|nr:hypothetical protein SOVF_142410 [Spinacia oleracea]